MPEPERELQEGFVGELRRLNVTGLQSSVLFFTAAQVYWLVFDLFLLPDRFGELFLLRAAMTLAGVLAWAVTRSARFQNRTFEAFWLWESVVVLLSMRFWEIAGTHLVAYSFQRGILIIAFALMSTWSVAWTMSVLAVFVGAAALALTAGHLTLTPAELATVVFFEGTAAFCYLMVSFAKYALLRLDYLARAEIKATQEPLIRRARLASLGRLLASIAEELARPLNYSLGGAVELGRRLGAMRNPAQEAVASVPSQDADGKEALAGLRAALELIDSGNTSMLEVIQRLRGYLTRKIGEGGPTVLVTELEAALELLRPRLSSDRILLSTKIEEVPPVPVDPALLGQLLVSLLADCCERAGSGGSLSIVVSRLPNQVQVELVARPGADTVAWRRPPRAAVEISRQLVQVLQGALNVDDSGESMTLSLVLQVA